MNLALCQGPVRPLPEPQSSPFDLGFQPPVVWHAAMLIAWRLRC